MGFGVGSAQAVQEHQLRSIVPQAHGASTLPPLDPEHTLAHHSVRHTEPQDSDDWLKRTNAHTQLSKAYAENQRHRFLYACGDQKWNARSDKRSTSFQKIYVCLARRAGAKQPKQTPKTSPKTQYGSVLIQLKCQALSYLPRDKRY